MVKTFKILIKKAENLQMLKRTVNMLKKEKKKGAFSGKNPDKKTAEKGFRNRNKSSLQNARKHHHNRRKHLSKNARKHHPLPVH